MTTPCISIAICTYNRAWLLPETLEALTRQTVSLDTFELIIVDNASTDNTAQVFAQFQEHFPHYKTLYEPIPGASRARNLAIDTARCDWICFLDDDVLVVQEYIYYAIQITQKTSFACIGGGIRPWRRESLPLWFIDDYESTKMQYPTTFSQLKDMEYVSCANMLVRRNVLVELNGFSSTFGPQGSLMSYGEETELQFRIRQAGYTIGFAPNILVYHHVKPERYTFKAQCIIRYKSGLSWQMIHKKSDMLSFFILLPKLVLSPLKGCAISIRKLYAGTYHWQNAVLEISGRFVHILGCLHGWYLLQKKRENKKS